MTASIAHRHRLRPPCPCGYCKTEHGFCAAHAARLAVFRAEHETGWKKRLASIGNGARTSTNAPTCCRPGCWRPRSPGESFCADCGDEGYADGIGE